MTSVTRREMIRTLVAIPAAAALVATSLPRFAMAADPATAPLEEAPVPLDFDVAPVAVVELADGLRVLTGPGGNITVYVGPDGPVVIDAGMPSRGADVLAAVKAAAGGAAPRVLVNTHWHFDHTGGNAALVDAGVHTIVAHENVFVRMSTQQRIEFIGLDVPPSPAKALPTLTFAQSATLRRTGQEMRLSHVGPAHTDGDVVVHFPAADVLVTGDLVFSDRFPLIDYSSGGSLDGTIAAADRLLEMAGPATKVVPGHGPITDRAGLAEFRDVLVTVRGRLAPLAARGLSLDDVQALRPLNDLNPRWGVRFLRGSNVVRMVYPTMLKGI